MIILRNKEFARKDYEGYSNSQKEVIKNERKKLAQEIRKKRVYNKDLINEIDKIAGEDLRKYVLNGAGKNGENSPEEIEKRRNRRRQRLYEPANRNREEIEKYLEEGKKRIKEKVGDKEPSIVETVKTKAKKLNIPYKKIGKYALGSAAVIGGTIGASKIIKSRKEAKKRERMRKQILGEK